MFLDGGVVFEDPLLVFLLASSLFLLVELLVLPDLFLEMYFVECLFGGFVFLDFFDLELIIGGEDVDFLLVLVAVLAMGAHSIDIFMNSRYYYGNKKTYPNNFIHFPHSDILLITNLTVKLTMNKNHNLSVGHSPEVDHLHL